MPEAESNSTTRNLTRNSISKFIIHSLWITFSVISFLAMMNEGMIDLFRQIVFNMVTALGKPAIDDDELDGLTLRTGHAGKL